MKVHQQYRTQARLAVDRASAILATGIDDQLRYAALELRLAMEALTYDRAQAYAKEIQPEAMSTWQPDKVMKMLLEVEPTAGSSYTLRIGEEPYPGGTPTEMRTLGTDTVFSLADLKRHYHAVGAVLHTPTMQQVEQAKPLDAAKLRTRLELIAHDLTKSLDSPVRNATFGRFASLNCQRCEKPVRKRLPTGYDEVEAECFSCGASYRLSLLDDGKVCWKPKIEEMSCTTDGCMEVFELWCDELQVGARWRCKQCDARYRIELGVVREAD
ncbi:hypothetical protein ACDI97_10665 [Xanthomonas axonopodis pv. fascicularis]|uniref:hypothetical protein n=1 Tax=Xanthomonas axonopodis TaxID=53413 RepID=UPI00353068C0